MSQILLLRTSMPFPGCCNTRWQHGQRPITLGRIYTLTTVCNFNYSCPCFGLVFTASQWRRFDIFRDMSPRTWTQTSPMSSISLPVKTWLSRVIVGLSGFKQVANLWGWKLSQRGNFLELRGVVVVSTITSQQDGVQLRIPTGAVLCRVCMFSPCKCGLSPTTQKHAC